MSNTTHKTRVSPDVWHRAADVATCMGLATPRQAIEAVFRVYADCYTLGQRPTASAPTPSPETHTPATPAKPKSVDCVAALDSLLSA